MEDTTTTPALTHIDIRRIARQREIDSLPKSGVQPRSSYTRSNALLLKPFFEESMRTTKDVCIPYDIFTCKLARCYQLATDALLWLCREADTPEDCHAWLAYKSQVKFINSMDVDKGVIIQWRVSGKPSLRAAVRGIQEDMIKTAITKQDIDFTQRAIEWLENDSAPLKITGLSLSGAEQQSIRALFEAAGITDYEVATHKIIAIKS